MPQFMLLLRDNGSFPTDISPEEIQSMVQKYKDWNQRIGGTGHKLRDGEGRLLRKSDSVMVTDGPFAEAREILGGYMLVEAASYDEVVSHCQDSPHLAHGSIEIRQVDF